MEINKKRAFVVLAFGTFVWCFSAALRSNQSVPESQATHGIRAKSESNKPLVTLTSSNLSGERMAPEHLCEIGSIPWGMDDIRKELKEFQHAYDRRPVAHSVSGSNLFHAFAQWCLIRMLQPQYIIESGTMLGWGTYMLRKAAGCDAHIVVLSPESPERVGKDRKQKYFIDYVGPSTYLTEDKFTDFSDVDWEKVGIDTPAKKAATLIYFDDHQSGYRRLLEAQRAGFVHAMYDDGYPWPGDNYALKQTCDRTGVLEDVRASLNDPGFRPSGKVKKAFAYYDDFANFNSTVSLDQKKCMADDMAQRLHTYFEFPPLWHGGFRQQNSAMLPSIQQHSVMSVADGEKFLSEFENPIFHKLKTEDEASKYTFFAYTQMKQPFKKKKDCLSDLKMPAKYRVIRK